MFGDPEENPMNWPIKQLSDVAKVDGTMTKEYEKYANLPHIGIDSIEKNTGILSGYRTVKEDNVISPKYHFGPQHILYSKIRPALNKVAVPDFEGLCSADCYPLLPIDGFCERKFLAHVLRSDYFLRYVLSFSVRSQMPKVNRKQLEGFRFPCPPVELQRKFIILVEQSDKSKFVRFKSQFIEMFGDPATNSKNLPIATLQDLGTNLDNRRIPITGGDRKAGEYPYYGASGIVDYVADYIFDDDLLLISEDGANLVARVTPIAFPSTGKVWINNHAHVIKFNSMAMQCYVENLLNMMDISLYVTGTAQPKLNQAKLNSIPIPVPEEDQIREYLEFVKQSDKSK